MATFNDETGKSDHSEEIAELRHRAETLDPEIYRGETVANQLNAAAAILEVHDQTGLSLDEWNGPRQWIEDLIGKPIIENHA